MGRLMEKYRRRQQEIEIENYSLLRIHVAPFIRILCKGRYRNGDYIFEFRAADEVTKQRWRARMMISPEMFKDRNVIRMIGEEVTLTFKRQLAFAYGKIHVEIK